MGAGLGADCEWGSGGGRMRCPALPWPARRLLSTLAGVASPPALAQEGATRSATLPPRAPITAAPGVYRGSWKVRLRAAAAARACADWCAACALAA